MIICPWCGQQTKSDAVCDWCKRPLDRKVAPPPGARSDLDFLKDESEVDRYGILKIAAGAACAVAIGAALYFVLFHQSNETAVAQTGGAAQQTATPVVSSTTVPPARLVFQPQFRDHTEEFWLNNFDVSNARGANWTNAQPPARGSANVPVNFAMNSPVKLQNVEMTMISLPGNVKRVAGRADIVNTSDKNVVDYRIELVWAANDYSMMPLQGTQEALHQVYQRALRPGKKMAVQLVSLKIKNRPEGTPNAVRLTAWLDGSPGTGVDEYQLQFSH